MKNKILILFAFVYCFGLPVLDAQSASTYPTAKIQLLDNNGDPCNGCKVHFFRSGTSTRENTYTSSTAGSANANPVVLDSSGRANIWLGSAYAYRVRLDSSADVTIWGPIDNVINFGQILKKDLADVTASTGDALVGYVGAGSNTASRTVHAKFLDFALSPCDYSGADAGAKINNAIAALPSGGGMIDATCLTGAQSGGSAIAVSKNTHLKFCNITYTGQITATAAMHLEGCSTTATIIQSAASPVVTVTGTDPGTGLGTINRKVIIENIQVKNTDNGGAGITLTNAIDPVFNNVHIQGPGKAPSTAIGLLGAHSIDGVYTGLRIEGFEKGIRFAIGGSVRSNQNSFFGCHFENNADGVELREADGNAFYGSLFQGNDVGIRVTGGGGNNYTIDGGWFEAQVTSDIVGDNGDPVQRMTVINSKFPGSALSGPNIHIDQARSMTLIGNMFERTSGLNVHIISSGRNLVAINNIMGVSSATAFTVPAGTLSGSIYNGDDTANHTASFRDILPVTTADSLGSASLEWEVFAEDLDVGSGVVRDADGLKHGRLSATCTTGSSAGDSCTTTYSWGTAFANANYTPVCVPGRVASGVPHLSLNAVQIAASITVKVTALTAVAAQFSDVYCVALADE